MSPLNIKKILINIIQSGSTTWTGFNLLNFCKWPISDFHRNLRRLFDAAFLHHSHTSRHQVLISCFCWKQFSRKPTRHRWKSEHYLFLVPQHLFSQLTSPSSRWNPDPETFIWFLWALITSQVTHGAKKSLDKLFKKNTWYVCKKHIYPS